ncbi:MAG: dephospho-CoA kinase [Alphaproteobacteria bacterium]|nr:dephospho-CoA kinase [Alphaproteobacteria bacterium]
MIILGLTGSIGMGKSTAAATLQRLRVPLFDADRVVHRLLAPGGTAVEPVAAAFCGVRTAKGGIDRSLLGQRVFSDSEALSRLERIIHPMVEGFEKRFLAFARARREPIVVLDIPLLFESGRERRCDYVLVVSAPRFVQRQRVLRRPGMTEGRLAAILSNQMPDYEKRRRADFVVPTGLSRALSLRRLRAVVRLLRAERLPITRQSLCSYRKRRSRANA